MVPAIYLHSAFSGQSQLRKDNRDQHFHLYGVPQEQTWRWVSGEEITTISLFPAKKNIRGSSFPKPEKNVFHFKKKKNLEIGLATPAVWLPFTTPKPFCTNPASPAWLSHSDCPPATLSLCAHYHKSCSLGLSWWGINVVNLALFTFERLKEEIRGFFHLLGRSIS